MKNLEITLPSGKLITIKPIAAIRAAIRELNFTEFIGIRFNTIVDIALIDVDGEPRMDYCNEEYVRGIMTLEDIEFINKLTMESYDDSSMMDFAIWYAKKREEFGDKMVTVSIAQYLEDWKKEQIFTPYRKMWKEEQIKKGE